VPIGVAPHDKRLPGELLGPIAGVYRTPLQQRHANREDPVGRGLQNGARRRSSSLRVQRENGAVLGLTD
jgi:hypothetical protein